MKQIKDEIRHDAKMGIDYHARTWLHDGHVIEVNTDVFGHSVRVDGKENSVMINLSDYGLFLYVYLLFGRR